MPAPRAVAAPRAFELLDRDDVRAIITPEVEAQIEVAREKLRDLQFDFKFDFDNQTLRDQMDQVRDQIRTLEPSIAYARAAGKGFGLGVGSGFAFAPQIAAPQPPTPPAVAVRPGAPYRIVGSSEGAYSNGQRALENRHWEDAAGYFSQVISRGQTRVDGALYWKAYALAKLGRSQESLAAIAELRKSYASSKWLDDAKALELEVNQAAGKPISPEAETDEDLKLLALDALSHSDPERAFPALEKILKSASAPKLKRNALYVLADNKSPRAQQLLEQIARGGANPDLQAKAISFMPRTPNSGAVLAEIYQASNDTEVKRAALNALVGAKDKDRLLSVAKSEKNSDLRGIAYGYLGRVDGNPELWQLYQTETTIEGKEQILHYMYNNGNAEKLMEALRTEKDPKLRSRIAQVLGSYRTQQVSDALIALYPNEQDQQVKNAIIDQIFSTRNGKAMVDLAKAEKDQRMKLRMIERLGNIKNCKECADYLVEILNK
jgi:hypothetical protein